MLVNTTDEAFLSSKAREVGEAKRISVEAPPPTYREAFAEGSGNPISNGPLVMPEPMPWTPSGPGAVNGVEIVTKRDPIAGKFILDPSLPRIVSTTGRHHHHKHDCHKRPRNAALSVSSDPVAISCAKFAARRGGVAVDLAVRTSEPERVKGRTAWIEAGARWGDVLVHLREKTPGQVVGIETFAKHGHTKLFLPPTFAGIIEVYTKHSAIDTLPGIAHSTRFVGASGRFGRRKVCLLVGEVPAGAQGDYVSVYSKWGKVVIGRSGVDAV